MSTSDAIADLDTFFAWTDAGLGRKRVRCPRCAAHFELRLMDDILEAACPACGRGPFFERAREVEAAAGADEAGRVLVRLGLLGEEEVATAAEVRDPGAAASAEDETAGLVGAARALGFFSKSLYLAVTTADGKSLRARPLRELVSPEELREAVEVERQEGTPVGEVIAGLALEAQKEMVVAAAGASAEVNLDAERPSRDVLMLLAPGDAASELAIPLRLETAPDQRGGSAAGAEPRMVVAVRDPLDFELIDRLKSLTGREIRAVRASEESLLRALERLYSEREIRGEAPAHAGPVGPIGPGGPSAAELAAIEAAADDDDLGDPEEVKRDLEEARAEAAAARDAGVDVDDDELRDASMPDEPPGVRTLNLLILQAAEERAESVILEPLDESFRVRLRRGGRMREAGRLPRRVAETAVEQAMTLAGMDLAMRNRPQTGVMPLTIGGETLHVHVATALSANGPTASLSVRDAQFRLLALDAIALVPGDSRELRALAAQPAGLTVIASPPGDGRTTLLYALMRESDRRREHVISLERATKARVEGATQLAMPDYSHAAAALDRLGPDRVFVDDVLGGSAPREEVRLLVDLALAGRRVVATVDAPDALSGLARLAAAGVESTVLVAPLRSLVSLRLVRRVCPRCREDFEVTPDLARELGLGEAAAARRLAAGIGCWECGGTGYRGRSALVEVIPVDAAIRERARGLDIRQVRALAAERGVKTLPDKALFALRAGLTSLGQAEPLVRER